MDIEKIIRRASGKKEFTLSSNIPLSYLLRKGVKFYFGVFRGKISKIRIKKTGKNFFVGKKVKLLDKSRIMVGDNVRIEDQVIIDALSTEGVVLGDRVKIGEYSKIICSGTLADLGKGLIIGNDTSFAENSFFGAAGGISIGNDVIAGQNVRFHSENHNFSDTNKLIRLQGISRKGIKIGNDVWIGSGVVFLDGCEIGDGCIVAANSLVKDKFIDNSIIAGSPAKMIRRR
ncbi:MAG TPA: transferase [Enterococcus sp.]|uniref:acyltransferase n=1 Tax=Enterococcus malodoratus TaxID=71451 RepID=UPI000EC88C52|nr:transferase [Enterococcus sp.]